MTSHTKQHAGRRTGRPQRASAAVDDSLTPTAGPGQPDSRGGTDCPGVICPRENRPKRQAPQGESRAVVDMLGLQRRLPAFLPGRLVVRLGSLGDYRALERFHYRGKRPATWAAVICIEYVEAMRQSRGTACSRSLVGVRSSDGAWCAERRVVGVGVLSWPTAVSKPRQEVFGLDVRDYGAQVRWANENVRTISRVIIHPQFRGLGLARLIVEGLCTICPTRFVEARAAMGSVHPMFERAGMRRHDCADGAAYFWRELRNEPRP